MKISLSIEIDTNNPLPAEELDTFIDELYEAAEILENFRREYLNKENIQDK